MKQRVSRALPLALVIFLAFSGGAFAGDNAGAVFSVDQSSFSGVAAGGTISFQVSATGLVDVASFGVGVEFITVDAFDRSLNSGIQFVPTEIYDLTVLGLDGVSAFAPGDDTKALGGGGSFSQTFTGDTDLGVFTLTMASDYDGSEAQADIFFVRLVKLDNNDFDEFDSAAIGISIRINEPAPPPTVTSIDPAEGSIVGGTSVTISGANFLDGATVTIGGADAGASVVDASTLTATSPAGVEGAADVVVTNPDANLATLAGGFNYVPIITPTLSATTPTDASLDYSSVGSGSSAEGSDGEVDFGVSFTDNMGGAASGQTITWTITNNGSESVFLVSPSSLEIAANTTATPTLTTGGDGTATVTLDSEGEKGEAGTTSVTVVASTSADDSDGVNQDLSVTFSATWDVPVAAELASIAGEYNIDRTVLLQWAVASQTNNLGWEVYRSVDGIRFDQVGDIVPGEGTIDGFRIYNFTDIEPPQVDVIFYYLKQLDLDGRSARSEIIEVSTVIPLPTATSLFQNFPNPFNPETIIGFDLAEESTVTLTVYDITGQVVQTLADTRVFPAGHHSLVWNGLNKDGEKVSSGVYFYRLQTTNFSSMKKMTLLQ